MRSLRSGPGLWLLAFVGFFLLHASWAFAAPYDGPPDEQAHALRAAAVAHGEILPLADHVQETPRSLFREHCFEMYVQIAADCAVEPGGDETWTPQITSASYYNPVYYAVLGWPLAVWPDWTGILLGRLLTGAAMAALLASAVVAACRWTRHRGVLAGLVVAVTPMIAHLGGAINPNGLEITAGVALFCGLLPLLHEPQEKLNRAAVALVGISASILVTPRSLSLMWLGIIGVVMLIGASRARVRALLRERLVRGWLVVVALSVLASAAWTLLVRPNRLPEGSTGLTFQEILRGAFLDMWPNVANQMVGVMGFAETLQPRLVYVAWFMAAGLLVLGGFALGDRIDRLRMLVLGVATFVPLVVQEILLADQIGFFNQGRYFLPGAVGLPILGAHALARRGLSPANMRSITRMFATVLVPIQLLCLAFTMCRWQSGGQILNPLKGSWMPPLGPVLPLAAGALAVAVLLTMHWRASRVPVAADDAGPESPSPADDRDGTLVLTG